MKNNKGFTLIELMVVVSMIGILAAISLPAYQDYIQRTKVVEALSLAGGIKSSVNSYYLDNVSFPLSNAQAGVPEASLLIGNYTTSIEVEEGAVHVTLGNKVSETLQGKVLSLRPAVVSGSPESPISWLCGYDKPVQGMEAIGTNKTTVKDIYLPSPCREW